MAEKRKTPDFVYESLYGFLVAEGHSETAKTLLKDAKLNEKKLKTGTAASLVEALTAFKPEKRASESAAGASAKKAKVESSSDSDSSSSDSDSEDEKPAAKKAAPAPAAKAAAPAAAAKKVAAKAESSSDSDSSSSESEDEKPVAKKAAAAPAAKKAAAKAESSSDSDSSSSESEDEKPVVKKTPAKAPAAVATPAKAATPAPAAAAETPSGDVHKIVVKGLPWKTTEKELADFFKACGKAISCEIPLGEDGRSTGVGYLKFATRAELDAALALDGETWPGSERWLKIVEGTERPGRTFAAGVKPEGCDTVFVGNLPWDVDEDQMRELFGSCGDIDRVRFATGEDGSFKGFGHVQFTNGDSTDAAVALAGTNLNGRPIRVDYAPPRQRPEGGAAGGRGAGRGGSPGGRSPGGRGGAGFGGRGGRGGRGDPSPINKNKGTIAAGSGKKMTFGDDE